MPLDLPSLLNPPQLEAATWPEGPVCIVAGAGSGKTRVITHRLAYLVEKGLARPEECLAVTFTNKAARELQERVDRLLPGTGGRMWVSTFHSASARILREAHQAVGLPRGFVIYDQDDADRLIKHICDEMKLASDFIKVMQHRIEKLQHEAIWPERFEPDSFDVPGKRLKEVYRVYMERLRQAGAVDFGGLILQALRVVRDQPDASYSLRRIKHLVVDEYQDVNRAQSMLVESLAPRLSSLAVVGDDDQSIYRWRGASAYSLLRFTETFPKAHRVNLTENYRSTGRILKLANHVIQRNPGRLGKELWTRAADGANIILRSVPSERDEAHHVVQDIQEQLARGRKPSDVAVLYRTNAQSRPLEEALHRARTAYRILGGLRFYERREVKDVLAYLRLTVSPDSEMDFRRIINVPVRSIGATTVDHLAAAAQAHGVSLMAALSLPDDALTAAGLKTAGRTKLREFGRLMAEITSSCAGQPPSVALAEIMARTSYDQHLRLEEDGDERLENLGSLERAAADFEEDVRAAGEMPTVEAFLERVSLDSEVEAGETGADAVTLMTLHSAKGLEFPVVYLLGVEEGMLPSARALNSGDAEDLNEERRLCYVGMTRARERLTLTMCRRRMTFGEIREAQPSRFLTELPDEVLREHLNGDLHTVLRRPVASAQRAATQAVMAARTVERGATRVVYDDERPPSQPTRWARTTDVLDLDVDPEDMDVGGGQRSLARGTRVQHAQFGAGRVLTVSGSGPMARVDVEFPGLGVRRIVARFLTA